MITLATALAGANSTDAVTHYGGRVYFAIYGTWGSATAKVEMSPDGGTTWVSAHALINTSGVPVALAQTANGTSIIDLPECQFRVTTSGGTGTSLTVKYAFESSGPWLND